MKKITVKLTVNGEERTVETTSSQTLLYLLRDDLGLTGVKDACGGIGECGACTVLLDGEAVNSCMVLAGQADGREVITIEGIADKGEMDVVQQSFIEQNAVQCGYCTPGFVLSTHYFLKQNPHPTREEIRDALTGNLCRCTGYMKIIDAVEKAAKELEHA